jgi:hypothetical protein
MRSHHQWLVVAATLFAGCLEPTPGYSEPLEGYSEPLDSAGGSDQDDGAGSTSAPGSSGDDGGSGETGGGSGDTGGDSGNDHDGTSTETSGTGPDDGSLDVPPSEDAHLQQDLPDQTYEGGDDLRAGSGSASNSASRLLLKFGVDELQPDCSFSEATLRLYYHADGEPGWESVDPVLGVYRITTGGWVEHKCTWNSRNGSIDWDTPGGDFDPAAIDEVTVTGGQYGWVSWDVTDTVMAWCEGSLDNHGFMVRESPDDGGDQGRKLFFSGDYDADPTLRPVLHVELTGGGVL